MSDGESLPLDDWLGCWPQQEASRDVRSAPEHHLSRYFDWKVKKLKIAEAGRAIWLDTRAMHPADGHKKGGARIGVKSK